MTLGTRSLDGSQPRRAEQLLHRWREAVQDDAELATCTGLSRGALDDHIPRIIDDFARRLRSEHARGASPADGQQRQDAAEHGMHRWQQGYDIREAMREWGHLEAVIMRELDRYAASHLRLDLESSLQALQALEDERSKLLRETAHDLRGSVGVLASTTAVLAQPQVAGPTRDRFHNLLQQRISSMSSLLSDLVERERGHCPLRATR